MIFIYMNAYKSYNLLGDSEKKMINCKRDIYLLNLKDLSETKLFVSEAKIFRWKAGVEPNKQFLPLFTYLSGHF